jgi:uncharacterized protein (DUF58 family)
MTTRALPDRRAMPPPPATPIGLPAHWVRLRFRAWVSKRQAPSDTQLLTQRNIYILPTRAGLMFAVTLLVLLVASLNYQLNLGYVLTFLLAGSGAVSLHVTHSTLRGLTLHVRPPGPVFAGDSALLECVLTSPDRARFGIGLSVLSTGGLNVSWTNVPARGQATAQVSFVPGTRGLHPLPALNAETRFPLGLFRAWTIWRPASRLLVYPKPEQPAPALPSARAVSGGGAAQMNRGNNGETEGVRTYRRGDALKLVLWKKAAKALESGGELVSRDTSVAVHQQMQLDWSACGGLADEQRLSRLAAWIIAAQRAGVEYALLLPGVSIPAAGGETHRRQCLEALALWR